MGAHNKAHMQELSRSSATWYRNSGSPAATTLGASVLLEHPVLHQSGATNVALTLPAPSRSGLEGLLSMFVSAGTGVLTVEASDEWGGLASTTTLTVTQGSLAFVMCGPELSTASVGSQLWYGPTVDNTVS